jgi:error-prone DNA polymerase
MNILYIELHSHSYYSLLDGASSTAKLAEQATYLGMSALALTDHEFVLVSSLRTNGKTSRY